MTTLSNQLKNLKIVKPANRLEPNQAPSSLLFTEEVARTIDIDIIYSMAVIGYQKIKDLIQAPSDITKEILSEQNKGTNRNLLTKQQNQQLSKKLEIFLLFLSPLLESTDCQKIIDYLLRNYSIHIFQEEYLALTFVQYFNTPIYKRLLKNLNLNKPNLEFLKPLTSNKKIEINLDMIVRAFGLNNYLLSFVRNNCIKLLSYSNHNHDIVLKIQQDNFRKANILHFLFSVNFGLINRNLQKHLPGVLQFIYELLKFNNDQAINMSMLMITAIIEKTQIKQVILITIIKTLIKKISKVKTARSKDNILTFLIIMWQRFSYLFTSQIISLVLVDITPKIREITQGSLAVIFYSLYLAYYQDIDVMDILKQIVLIAKDDKLITQNNQLDQKFYECIFQTYQKNKISLSLDKIQQLQKFFIEYLKFQFARYINTKPVQQRNIQQLKKIFVDTKISNKGISMKNIIRLKRDHSQKLNNKVENNVQASEVDFEQEIQDEEAPSSSLLNILKQSLPALTKVEYNKDTIPILSQLIIAYYKEQKNISRIQKNEIMEHLFDNYTTQMFKADLQNNDWTLPIKYVQKIQDVQLICLILRKMIGNFELINDFVYKDLLKTAIIKLVETSKNSYNKILNILSKFGDQLLKIIESDRNHLIVVLEICTFMAKKLIEKHSNIRGKLYRLVLVHVKILTQILNSNLLQNKVFSIFEQILKVYGQENLYIFYLGFSQQIIKFNFNSGTIQNFKKVIIQLFLIENTFNIDGFINSCVKSIQLNSILIQQIQSTKKQNKATKFVDLPKKILTNLFGLINPKQKKKIIRNTLFIIRYLFLSNDFSSKLQLKLKKSDQSTRLEIINSFSTLYKAIIQIKTQNAKLKASLQNLLSNLANLFPLSILVKLMFPLMPNDNLYSLLYSRLLEHPKFTSKTLQDIILVYPQEITLQWIKFIKICLERSCKINQPWIKWLLNNHQNIDILSIITEISKHQHYILIPYLKQISVIIINVLGQKTEYSLAIVHTLIKQLSGLLDPYLDQIFKCTLEIESEFMDSFYSNLVQVVDTSSLINLAISNLKDSNVNYDNLSTFMIHLASKGTGEQLIKPFLQFLQNVSARMIEDFQNIIFYLKVQQKQAQAFKNIIFKLNEIQLRKVISKLASWSQKQNNSSAYLPFNLKKIVVMKITKRLTQNMAQLFVPFYSFFYEAMLSDLNNLQEKLYQQKSQKKNPKRKLELDPESNNLCSSYLILILQNLKLIFGNDPEQQFIDSSRFDQLIDPLSKVFECTKINEIKEGNYTSMIQKHCIPALVALCNNIKDDYKLKTLNYNILLKLKNQNSAIRLSIFNFVLELINVIGDRYLVIINDLIPFVGEYIDSIDQNIQKIVKTIVTKLEGITGEDIKEYLKIK